MDRDRILAEVELERRTVEEAVRDGVAELGLTSVDDVDVTVLTEGKPGFLGIGREYAKVVVKRKPKPKAGKGKRRRRRKKRGKDGDGGEAPKTKTDGRRGGDSSGDRRGSGQGRSGRQGRQQGGKAGRPRQDQGQQRQQRGQKKESRDVSAESNNQPDIEAQATIASEFLTGLLGAFGLEGNVTKRVDEDIVYLDVTGEQTEALVGPRGTVMEAVLELTRTVIQRKTYGAPRLRLDIAGYGERRREALRIYAGKLAERVREEGGEVMLEPMNPADRKAVHDAVADLPGVISFSEGEDQHRAVVIAPDPDAPAPAPAPDSEEDASPEDASPEDGDDNAAPDHSDDSGDDD